MFLEGKRALVTGSTSGIGLAIARAQFAIGPQRLHETLTGAHGQPLLPAFSTVLPAQGEIVIAQFRPLGWGQTDVGIVKQRRQIIFRASGTQALVVDHPCVAVTHDDVLRLEIAVHR